MPTISGRLRPTHRALCAPPRTSRARCLPNRVRRGQRVGPVHQNRDVRRARAACRSGQARRRARCPFRHRRRRPARSHHEATAWPEKRRAGSACRRTPRRATSVSNAATQAARSGMGAAGKGEAPACRRLFAASMPAGLSSITTQSAAGLRAHLGGRHAGKDRAQAFRSSPWSHCRCSAPASPVCLSDLQRQSDALRLRLEEATQRG
jgi:hypothetical protein